MSERISSVIDQTIVKGKFSTTVRVPVGTKRIQVVFDRTRFEDVTLDKHMYQVQLTAGRWIIGGAGFAGGRVDPETATGRPGKRILWDFNRCWLVDKEGNPFVDENGNIIDLSVIKIELETVQDFSCLMDVDFF